MQTEFGATSAVFPAILQLSSKLGLVTKDNPKQLEAFLDPKLHEITVKVNK